MDPAIWGTITGAVLSGAVWLWIWASDRHYKREVEERYDQRWEEYYAKQRVREAIRAKERAHRALLQSWQSDFDRLMQASDPKYSVREMLDRNGIQCEHIWAETTTYGMERRDYLCTACGAAHRFDGYGYQTTKT